ncbi:MAG: Hsp20/alpha crystallin family protein [Chloroflexota bacterium]
MLERWRPRGLREWSPFWELDDVARRFEDMFGRPLMRRFPLREGEWLPSVEMYEKDNNFVVRAELPGMKEEDVDVSVSDDLLTIRGEKKGESEVKDEDYYVCERSYGSFSRTIRLPSNADTGKVDANFEDGVLEVTVPKTAEAKAKKIPVSAKSKSKK